MYLGSGQLLPIGIAAAAPFFYLAILLDASLMMRRQQSLAQIVPASPPLPRISIIAAARNEERKIGPAVRSLLAQDYPDLEVVLINDRSTDRTAEILAEISREDRRLQLITIDSLPAGWLGKNHALDVGAAAATGEFFLFTDADVILDGSVLRRAIAFVRERSLDHLACAPEMTGGTLPLRIFVSAFSLFFSLYARPWRARDPRSRAHVGVGAFNLVRASLYRAFGGHERIAMRPDDDMMLGKLVKLAGGRQDFLGGGGLVKVEWYSHLPEAIDGMRKNAFCGLGYSVARLLVATVALILINVWPVAAIALTTGPARLASMIAAAVIVGVAAIFSWRAGSSPLFGLTYPIATLVFIYVLWNSAIKALREGGILWRETFYSLDELRANRI
jgi:Glycosyl transferase family 2